MLGCKSSVYVIVLFCIYVCLSICLGLSILLDHLEDGLVDLFGVSSAQVMTTSLNKVERSFRAGSKEFNMLSGNSRTKDRIRSALK